MGMISLLTYSSSKTLANSPSLEAAARLTIGVSSEHKFRKYLQKKKKKRQQLFRENILERGKNLSSFDYLDFHKGGGVFPALDCKAFDLLAEVSFN